MKNECSLNHLEASALHALLSKAPANDDNIEPFNHLIGEWDMEITDIASDGTEKRFTGSWYFTWGLGGRAVLDVWRVPGREHGLTVRFYDASIGAWRSTWIAPCGGLVMPFVGRRDNGELVLEHVDADGATISRWIFFEIADDSFRWRGEISNDGGKSWRLEQTMLGKRAAPAILTEV